MVIVKSELSYGQLICKFRCVVSIKSYQYQDIKIVVNYHLVYAFYLFKDICQYTFEEHQISLIGRIKRGVLFFIFLYRFSFSFKAKSTCE